MVSSTKVTCVPNCCCSPRRLRKEFRRTQGRHRLGACRRRAVARRRRYRHRILHRRRRPVRTVVLLRAAGRSKRCAGSSSTPILDLGSWPAICCQTSRSLPEYYTLEDSAGPRPATPSCRSATRFSTRGRFSPIRDLAAEWKSHASALRRLIARCRSRSPARVAACADFRHEHTYEAVLEHGFDRKPYDAAT